MLKFNGRLVFTLFLLETSFQGLVQALDNGLGRTPAMGWNSWNLYACNISEDIVISIADALVSSGLRDLGYKYVTIDDCWQTSRNASGHIQADLTRFPSGMKSLGERLHSRGLKFGIYSSAGDVTCEGRPGSLGYEEIDAQSYAEWGVDLLKYDNCGNKFLISRRENIARYGAMRDALNKTNRPIYYSICNWGQASVWEWGSSLGNAWRTTGDIGDLYEGFDARCPCTIAECWYVKINGGMNHCSVLNILDKMVNITGYGGPGGFNDMDMLEIGNGGMSTPQYRTHFSLWAALKSPLILGNDVTNMSPENLAIVSNAEVIAVNQDQLGKSAHLVHRVYVSSFLGIFPVVSADIWVGELEDEARVVVLVNRLENTQDIPLDIQKHLNRTPGTVYVRDLWAKRDIGAVSGVYTVSVPGHDVAMFKVTRLPHKRGEQVVPELRDTPTEKNEVSYTQPVQKINDPDEL